MDWVGELHGSLANLEHASGLDRDPVNEPGSLVFVAGWGDYKWRPLAPDGPMIQKGLIGDVGRFAAVSRALLRGRPDQISTQFDALLGVVEPVLQQEKRVYDGDHRSHFTKAREALSEIVSIVRLAYPAMSEGAVLVPDTNALLFNPALESWRFSECEKFTLVLVPTVLAELDQLKVIGRDAVKEKSERVIRQIKEYRRRGSLNAGVVLAANVSKIATRATEPKEDTTLPWLDLTNADDRILGSVVEVMRDLASSAVAIVTRDVNLQNKAEYARVPFLEPPDPAPTQG